MEFKTAFEFYEYRIFNETFIAIVEDLATRSTENIRTRGVMAVEDKRFRKSAVQQTAVVGVTVLDLVHYGRSGVRVELENKRDIALIHGYVTGYLTEWHKRSKASANRHHSRDEPLIHALTEFSESIYPNIPREYLELEDAVPVASVGLLAPTQRRSKTMRGQEPPFKREDYGTRYKNIRDGLKSFR